MGNIPHRSPPVPLVPGDVVCTKSGPVKGRKFTFTDDEGHSRECNAFMGIPYAEPPVGELRFKKPVPVNKWTEVKECYEFGPRCPQLEPFLIRWLPHVKNDEAGCLNLNVFTPTWKSDEFPNGFPVMLWIHGGGYTVHASANYGDKELCRNLCVRDVIVVSINYRLGAFGFFTTSRGDCNFGLWDQALALEWVHDNISAFGGDPTRITVFGQSAGAFSADLVQLSPHTRDYFSRAIAMSGSAECSQACQPREKIAAISREFARLHGFKGDLSAAKDEEILSFMRSLPASALQLSIHGRPELKLKPYELIFTPVFDGDFFPKPLDALRRELAAREVLVGTVDDEGLLFSLVNLRRPTVKSIREAIHFYVKDSEYEDVEALREKVEDVYLGHVDCNDKAAVTRQFLKLLGDIGLTNGTFEMANKMSELGHKVFLYNFEYFNPNAFGLFKPVMPYKAATHGMELRYVLGKGVITKFIPNEEDLKMLKIMTSYFTNFAKYGDPNGVQGGVWKAYDPARPFEHLCITLDPHMKDDFQEGRALVWRDIHAKRICPRTTLPSF